MPPLPLVCGDLQAAASAGGFWSYIAGVTYHVLLSHPKISSSGIGISVDNYRTTLPLGKGLSSSAAVCVLTARALSLVFGLGLTLRDEMEYAYLGEIETPSACGRMD